MYKYLISILLISLCCSCKQTAQVSSTPPSTKVHIVDYPTPGVERLELYKNKLVGKQVGIVVNKASRVEQDQHLLDFLLDNSIHVKKIFAPEHGFRGEADAGSKIDDEIDSRTGLPIISLYGKHKKPTKEDYQGLDIIVFDLQDVGVRFYTYISTLHYVMEACAEQNVPLIILDRPNPNGFYVAGPILEDKYQSFVGMHPVPIVYGMTIGEYGMMINGEGWLKDGAKCGLEVVQCKDYVRNSTFELPVRPSPNLPNHKSVLLYPSLCLFEGTTVSVGRGTDAPFQQYGHPKMTEFDYSFVPKSGFGAKYPKHENTFCFGEDLDQLTLEEIIEKELDFSYLSKAHNILTARGEEFFNDNNFFEKLAGTEEVRKKLVASESLVVPTKVVEQFKDMRSQYLLYE